MMQTIIQNLLLNDAVVGPIVGNERVFTTPLKRPGSDDPELAGYQPTPEAFEAMPPYFILPSIVVNRPYRVSDTSLGRREPMLARWIVPLAYYAPPDAEDALAELSQYAGEAIGRNWIDLPGNLRGRVVVPHATSPPADVPEMPGSGVQMLEDIEVAHTTDRRF